MRGVVLLLAAGKGLRLGAADNKIFLDLDGVSVLRRAADAAEAATLVDGIVVAVHPGAEKRVAPLLNGITKDLQIIAGGPTRQASAAAALAVAEHDEAVLVHDAARPLAPPTLFDRCLRELDTCEAVVPAIPLADTVKEIEEGYVSGTLDRSRLVGVQTPQGFRLPLYRRAHLEAKDRGWMETDDASLVEKLGVRVRLIPGDDRNLKITTKHDADVAEALLRASR